MRVHTVEIRWHDSKPISSCDLQPKRARPPYKLASAGEDNHVRLWAVHPTPPRVEYLATLSRHSAAVNVVRWSPNGDLIASAGDDGMIIIWTPTTSPHTPAYGTDLSPEDLQYEKEHWKPRTTFRCTTMQVYDLAWSPTGEYIIAGSTDNCARIFSTLDGKCVHELAEHTHYVQGVAWDPLNEYIATQSSDRSMHVYSISHNHQSASLQVHALGKNTKITVRASRTPSRSRSKRPPLTRAESSSAVASESESEYPREESVASASQPPLSVPSTPSLNTSMFPPPPTPTPSTPLHPPTAGTMSRRSSISSSIAPSSPITFTSHHSRVPRSPSPMPALPAIRMPTPREWVASIQNVKLYGDEGYTNFFRRLTFSPDGALLMTPAGQFEDPSVLPALVAEESTRGRKGKVENEEDFFASEGTNPTGKSSVYVYTRANFARPPVACLPGHKKASIVVRFSPILYELRSELTSGAEPAKVLLEKGTDKVIDIDLVGKPVPPSSPASGASSKHTPTGGVFALPYRMLFAVATMDTVAIHDTQQSGPIAVLTRLHYDEFTDIAWSPDGQTLILSSRDGYCTLVTFDETIPAHHTQQQTLQFQSIAHHNWVPLASSLVTPLATPVINTVGLPQTTPTPSQSPAVVPLKRGAGTDSSLSTLTEEPTPGANIQHTPSEPHVGGGETKEPPKKKRRAALTRVEDLTF